MSAIEKLIKSQIHLCREISDEVAEGIVTTEVSELSHSVDTMIPAARAELRLLLEYVAHKDTCATQYRQDQFTQKLRGACDCGLEQFLERFKEGSDES